MPAGRADIHQCPQYTPRRRNVNAAVDTECAASFEQYARRRIPACYTVRIVMRVPEAQLKRFVLDTGLVPRAALEEAEAVGGSLAEALLAQGVLAEDDLRRATAYLLGVPYVSLATRELELSVLTRIPEPVARAHSAVALSEHEGTLEVALLDLDDLAAVEPFVRDSGLALAPRLTDTESMRSGLRQYQRALEATYGSEITRGLALLTDDASGGSGALTDGLLTHALAARASDVHIEPSEQELRVRYRIAGRLRDALTLPAGAAAGVTARLRALARLTADANSGRFRMESHGEEVSVQLSVVPVVDGEKVVLSFIRAPRVGFSLETLGFHGEALEVLAGSLTHRPGLVLVAGPHHSGVTTTLYTLLDLLNTPEAALASIEERIEYRLARVSQTEVRSPAGLTMAAGLRSLLRQDPDVLLVGGIPDEETAALAVAAAGARRTVLAGVEAATAAEALERMRAHTGDAVRLAETVEVVVATRLAQRIPSTERQTLSPTELAVLAPGADLERVLRTLRGEGRLAPEATWYDVSFYRRSPGGEASPVGFVGLHEVLPLSRTVRALVASGATAKDIEAAARREGVLTLEEDALYAAALGLVSLDDALSAVA